MIIVMEQGATEEQIEAVIDKLVALDFSVHRSTGAVHTVLGGIGPTETVDPEDFLVMDGVKECHRVISPYKLSARPFKTEGTVVRFGHGPAVGASQVAVMAGPALVESEDQIERIAESVAKAGARFLRGGVHPPRTTPYGFQGLGEKGLELLRRAATRYGLLPVCEILDHTQIAVMEPYVDLLLIGSRNMQNFQLLTELGKTQKPVLLKRGVASTIEELLLAAEVLLAGGNYNVILCERGIRTFAEPHTMDISAIPVVKKLSHLPIVADPSHGTGRRDKVIPMARAAVAAGADGLLIEVHPDPDHALCDGAQSIRPDQFAELMGQLKLIAGAVGRTL